jgi:hypothetical protein
LVKVLNPAFYGGGDSTVNQNMSSSKKEQPKKEIKNVINEPKKEDSKLRADKKKTGKNASKSMPKNISDKAKQINNKGFSNNNNLGYGYNEADFRNRKKNANKSNEHFEKEKKIVSVYIYIYIFSFKYSNKRKML